ncbi:MAG: SDR family NAD(P)-dependent oxidoreductase [Acidimicrobiales bacterium]
MRLAGARIVVTGASSGIGRDTTLRLARRGAHVWAVARNGARLATLADACVGITPFVADVSIEGDRAALVEAAGQVDVLVNNAGLGWSGMVEDMSAADVRQLFEVNVIGLIDLTQRVLPGMLERRRGHIVNVGSLAGWVSAPPLSVYSATKFAVAGFSEGLRREVVGRGVTVALIAPGPLGTEFLPRSRGQADGTGAPLNAAGLPPASLASRAIVRSIRLAGVPGWATIAVPRVSGLARLGAAPALARLVDVVSVLTRARGQQ